ncbi:enolase C-terminal domain-like protein [Neobacillus niacini]|uniref:enolase C-terminal domain-like protein n=1 Tax=Neobacillus niacini TaxID=86668 RepID=UPI002FFF5DC3
MKITDVQILFYTRPMPDIQYAEDIPASYSGDVEVYVVKILTDEGIEGYGGGIGYTRTGRATAEVIRQVIKPNIIGEDPLNREKIWQKLWRIDRLAFMPQTAIGPIDVALWDLAGKIANLPIYKLLGAYRDKLPAYASGQTLPSIEAYAEQAIKAKESGYTAYKLHPFGDPAKDIAAAAAVREAVGDNFVLMLDAVASYDYTSALQVGRSLEQLKYHWFEEPLRDVDIHGYRKLAQDLDIPIAGVEVLSGSLYTTPEYIVTNAVDIVRSDVTFKGGLTPLMKTAHLAEAFGMRCEIHCVGGMELMEIANLHAACAIKNCYYHEILVPEDVIRYGVCEQIKIDKEGQVHAPQGPGLGVELDWEYINSNLKYIL